MPAHSKQIKRLQATITSAWIFAKKLSQYHLAAMILYGTALVLIMLFLSFPILKLLTVWVVTPTSGRQLPSLQTKRLLRLTIWSLMIK